jgi:hypothetical protein
MRLSGITSNCWDKDLPAVLERINKRIMEIPNRALPGLIKAVILIHDETLKGDTTTPIDLGNLRQSWFVVTSRGAIQTGGGKTHEPENTPQFTGPRAGHYAALHTSALTEMRGKANLLAKFYEGPFVILGYSVDYALWVHENTGAEFKHDRDEKTGAKWFQRALAKHEDRIVNIVAEEARKTMKR